MDNREEYIVTFDEDERGIARGWDMHGKIVRCKDCKHSYEDVSGRVCTKGAWLDCVVTDDFFCAYGEEGDDNG